MKQIGSIVIVCCLFFTGYAQSTKTNIDEVISFALPADVVKPSQEKLETYFSKRKHTVFDIKQKKATNFIAGEVTLLLSADTGSVPNDFLEKRKKFLDHYHLPDEKPVYKSEIKKINNYKVFIEEYEREHFNYYSFLAINSGNSKAAGGRIEYPKADSVQAKALLDYLLKNMRFK